MKLEQNSIEKIIKGDIVAFKEFFEGFYPALYSFAKKYLDDEEVIRDLLQDSFIYFWKKREIFFSESAAKSYLYKHVKNRSLNYLRGVKKLEYIDENKLESEVSFRDFVVEEETYQIIIKALDKLSTREREIMELSIDGHKNAEISDQLNISLNTVKTLKMRAYKKLREELSDLSIILYLWCCR